MVQMYNFSFGLWNLSPWFVGWARVQALVLLTIQTFPKRLAESVTVAYYGIRTGTARRQLCISLQHPRQWRRLCKERGLPMWACNGRPQAVGWCLVRQTGSPFTIRGTQEKPISPRGGADFPCVVSLPHPPDRNRTYRLFMYIPTATAARWCARSCCCLLLQSEDGTFFSP